MGATSSIFLAISVGGLFLLSLPAHADSGKSLYAEMVTGRCSPSLPRLKNKATGGDASSQFWFGAAYSNGVCLEKIGTKWMYWLRKAADQGHTTAQFNLAVSYEFGADVEKDEASATGLYRKLAEQGVGIGQLNLGRMYEEGLGGLQRNDNLAVNWYRKAAEQGLPDASERLGRMYAQGRGGLSKDALQAGQWQNKAASRRACKPPCNEYCEFSRPDTPILSALVCLMSPALPVKKYD